MQADNADYWHCSLCTFHNPAKRSYCEICFATSTDNQPSTVTAVNEHLQPPPLPPLFAQLQDHLQQGCGLVRNTSVFVCPICFDNIAAGDGVVLCECLHEFCRGCLRRTVLISVSSLVRCPVVQADDVQRSLCVGIVVDSEIREILSADEYADHFKRSVHEAEIGEPGSFHCKTPNCAGWCILAKNQVLQPFVCPVCKSVNCVQCKVQHPGFSCAQYIAKCGVKDEIMLNTMISQCIIMKCPNCQILVQKKDGCNHLQCKICQHKFNWKEF